MSELHPMVVLLVQVKHEVCFGLLYVLNELVDENTDVSVARSREQTRECDVVRFAKWSSGCSACAHETHR